MTKFLRIALGSLILGLGILLVTGCANLDSTPDGAIGEAKMPENFQVVAEGILWRGARPGTPNEYQWLIEKGVKTIVNLEFVYNDLGPLERPLKQHSLRTREIAAINYAQIREREWDVVFDKKKAEDDVVRFIKLSKDDSKWPIYVHCREGKNRTGVAVAAYRVLVGNTAVAEAVEEMGRYRGFWFAYDKEFIESLANQEKRKHVNQRIADPKDEATSTQRITLIR